MNQLSQRRAFTGLMSILATAFAIGIWRQRFSWQSDFLADLFKIGSLVAVSTAVIGFVMWTLTHRKKDTLLRGSLAGGLTSLAIIPLPAIAWRFKTEFLAKFLVASDGIFSAFFSSIPPAIGAGLDTFAGLTKASLVAVIAGMFVGWACARFISARPRET